MTPRRYVVIGTAVVLAIAAFLIALGASSGDDRPKATGSRTDAWTALHPAILERTEVAAARIGQFIYVVGGFEKASGETTAAVERYNIETDRWRREASMPVGLNHPAAAAFGGDVYVLGGYTGRGSLTGAVASLYRYDPPTKTWTRLPSAPTRRAALAVGVIGGKLYAAGGVNSTGVLKRLEIYDFAQQTWSLGPAMGTAREHLAGAVADGKFYVLAGRASGQGNFKVAERYLPAQGRWQRLPDMSKPRGGIAAAAVGKRVVVFGGEEAAGTIKEVEIYDPATNRWSRLPDMLTPRHGLGGISRTGRVYAIEGGPTPGFDFSNAIEALDIAPAATLRR